MRALVVPGCECLLVLLPAVVLLVIFRRIYRKRGMKRGRESTFLVLVLALYLFGLFHAAGAGTLWDARRYGVQIRADQLNLIPFCDSDIRVMAYGLGVLLFVPFGFLLPCLWPGWMNRVKRVLVAGALLSLLIEVSQLLNDRRTDVDDLLLSLIGVLIGLRFFRRFARATGRTDIEVQYWKGEPFVYVSAMFLGRFLFFNELGLTKALYRF